MISFQKSFLFIHIPKTAGNSIQSVLRDYSEDQLVASRKEQDGIERFGLHNPTHARGEPVEPRARSGRLVWARNFPDSCYSGAVTTAGKLVFVGRNGGVVHFWLLVKADVLKPLLFAVAVGLLLAYRVVVAFWPAH